MASIADVLHLLGIEIDPNLSDASRLWAKCPHPDHADTHPSWSIMTSGEKRGLHYCASCHWGGTLIDLVVQVRKLAFSNARRWLSSVDAGTAERPPPTSLSIELRSFTSRSFQLPPEVLFRSVDDWPSVARSYALVRRGIPRAQIEQWRIGFAVDGGLGGRIVIVTRDRHGRDANYTGRTFFDVEPRYKNAREEESPDRSILFGEEFWNRQRVVVVVEGALKALAVSRVFPSVAVAALSGSNVHPSHLVKLASFPRVVSLTDADRAGEHAHSELLQSLARSTDFREVKLPRGEDADSIVLRDGPDKLRTLLAASLE